LLEQPDCWRALQPQVLPMILSPARRLNVVMRTCFVLVSNKEGLSNVVSIGTEDEEGQAAKPCAPNWVHRGLELFARVAFPLFSMAAQQSPKAFRSLSGTLCRWYPQRTFQALLEALASTDSIDREARGALFRCMRDALQHFEWPCRYTLYKTTIEISRVDSIIGAVVTMFKDDWWPQVLLAGEDQLRLAQERLRMVDIFRNTLSGDVQVVDGMDTLTAALNIARLVALNRGPAGVFLRASLRKGGQGLDLDALLGNVSQQIDFELKVLETPGQDLGYNAELAAQTLGEALGAGGGGGPVDLQAMKKDRITMVAHLVARVREIFVEAES